MTGIMTGGHLNTETTPVSTLNDILMIPQCQHQVMCNLEDSFNNEVLWQ